MLVAINITFSLTQHFLCYFPQTHVFIESSIIVPPMLWDLGFEKVNLSHLVRRKLSKIPPFSNSAPIFFWLFRKKTQRRGNSFLLKDPFLLPSVSKDSFQQKKWKMIRILVNYDGNLFLKTVKMHNGLSFLSRYLARNIIFSLPTNSRSGSVVQTKDWTKVLTIIAKGFLHRTKARNKWLLVEQSFYLKRATLLKYWTLRLRGKDKFLFSFKEGSSDD